MTAIVGGHGLGLLDTSLSELQRTDRTDTVNAGHGEGVDVNVDNGNLVVQHTDVYEPSVGSDFSIVRTYNSRAGTSGGWSIGNGAVMAVTTAAGAVTGITVTYADGSTLRFTLDSTRQLWTSPDGAGAFETIQVLPSAATDGAAYVLTRADETQYRFNGSGTLLSTVDPNGVTTTYTYQNGNQVASITDGTGTTFTFQYTGTQLTQISDSLGNTLVTYGYTNNLLTDVIDRAGLHTGYTYNAAGQLVGVALPNQQTVTGTLQTYPARNLTFAYGTQAPQDGLNNSVLTQVTDAMGGVTSFAYRQNVTAAAGYQGGTTAVTDALGRTATYTHDRGDYLTAITDAAGYTTTFTYDAQHNLVQTVDRNGNAVISSNSAYYRALRADLGVVLSSGAGKPVNQLTPADIAALLARFTTTYTYDSHGNMLSRTDGNGNVTTWTYTSFDKPATMTAADGNALATSNDPYYQQQRLALNFPTDATTLSAALQASLRARYTTTYTYDANENLIVLNEPQGGGAAYSYDSKGDVTTVVVSVGDGTGRVETTHYAYDAAGNITSMVDSLGNTKLYTYDTFGNPVRIVDARGGVTTQTFDAANRLISTTDPAGNTTVYAYDAVGNTIAITDASGHTVTRVFDANNNLITEIDPGAVAASTRTTQHTYDRLGNQTQVTDAEGRVTTYTYDADRRILDVASPSVPGPNGAPVTYHTQYAYDGEGNVITVTDANGNVTQHLYTPTGLLRRTTDATGNVTEYLYDANLNQIQITVGAQLAPALRRVTTFGYDQRDRKIKETDALGFVSTTTYDAVGNVLSVTDANGNTTTYAYDLDNRRVQETAPATVDTIGRTVSPGGTVQHAYDANGNEISTTDENGHVTTIAFDADNRKILVTDPNGVQTVFAYDSRGNQTEVAVGVQAHLDTNGTVVIDNAAPGKVTTYQFDGFGQVVAATDAVGNALVTSDDPLYQGMRTRLGLSATVAGLSSADKSSVLAQYTEQYTYDRVGNLVASTDHLGRVTQYQYDGMDRKIGETDAAGTAIARTLSWRYDGNGNVVGTVDALGRTESYTYDAADRRISQTDPTGNVVRFTYDNVGHKIRMVTNAGASGNHVTRWSYDLDDRITSQTDALGNVETYGYDKAGNLIQDTDPAGGITRFVYDARNRNIQKIDALGNQSTVHYDAVGNRISLANERGAITTFVYDPNNRLLQTTDGDGRTTAYQYNALGDTVAITRAAGFAGFAETTRFVYDAEGNLRQTIDAAGQSTTQDFDAVYHKTAVTDENGYTTHYGFDALDRRITVTDPLGGVTTYAYDAADNVLKLTNVNGGVTTYTYDPSNRLLSETDPAGARTEYTYDTVGNQASITEAAGTPQAATRRFTYSALDQLVTSTDALGLVTRYTYDSRGNVSSVTDARGGTTSYTYDANNHVATITDPTHAVTTFIRDASGNAVQVIDPRGFRTTRYYNANDEVMLSVDGAGGVVAYTHDPLGNLVQVVRYLVPIDPTQVSLSQFPTVAGPYEITLYRYDALNRLVGETDPLGNVTSYGLDNAGRRVTSTDARGNVTQYTYDGNDRLTSVVDPLGGKTSYTRDAMGNILSKTDADGNVTTYAYDADSRLVSQTDALGGVSRMGYDALGNLLTSTDPNGHTTTYVYDLDNRIVTITNPLGGIRRRSYDGTGNLLSETDENGNVSTYVYDGAGRITRYTDPLGHLIRYQYDAAGNLVATTDANGNASHMVYDGANRQTQFTDALGYVTNFSYDAVGNRISIQQQLDLTATPKFATQYFYYDADNRVAAQLSAQGYLTTATFDAVGNEVTRTLYDNLYTPGTAGAMPAPAAGDTGRTVRSTYDADNRLASKTSALGIVTGYQYDAVGNKTAIVEAQGTAQQRTSSMRYDALNRLTDAIDAAGTVTHQVFDAAGNLIESHDAFGTSQERVQRYAYDANNRQIQKTDALGIVTRQSYDSVGNLVTRTLAAGTADARTETFQYDARNRMTAQINGMGERTQYTYDFNGNTTSITVAPGLPEERHNRFVFDADNRMVGHFDGDNVETQYRYDGAGNKIETIQYAGTGNGGNIFTPAPASAQRHTLYAYDLDNRMVSVTDPMGGVTTYQYDALGNQVRIVDANGNVTTNTFDLAGHLLRNVLGGVFVQNTYDVFGNVVSALQGFDVGQGQNVRRTDYRYDALDRRVAVTQYDVVGSVAANQVYQQAYSTLYTYDVFGNQLQVTQGAYLLNPGDAGYDPAKAALVHPLVATFAYDADSRLVSATDGVGDVTAFAYDRRGNRTTTTTGSGTSDARTVTLTYDLADRVVLRDTPDHAQLAFTYDKAGNQTSRTIQGYNLSAPRTTLYRYDGNGRIISETSPLGTVTNHQLDAFGNEVLTTYAAGTADQRVLTQFYDKNDRLIETRQGSTLNDPRTLYSYDSDGNRIAVTDPNGAITRLYYDARNQQIATLDPLGYLTTFAHDAQGNVTATSVYMNAYAAGANGLVPPVPGAGDPVRTTLADYDSAGHMVRQTGADGRVVDRSFDSAGKLVQITDHGSADATARAQTQDLSARTQTFAYDAAGRLIRYVRLDGAVETYTYDTANNRTSVTVTNPSATLANGSADPVRTITSSYDGENHLVSETTDPGGLQITQTLYYDAAGEVIGKFDGSGNLISGSQYDLDGRLIAVTTNTVRTAFGYDRVGNRTSITDGNGNTTNYVYNAQNRLVQIIQPSVVIVTVNQNWTLTQARGRPTTTFQYDKTGNQVQITDANGNVTTRYYDGNGNIVAEVNGDNTLRTYTYDATNALLTASLYMTPLPASAHNPNVRPTPPAGEVRTVTNVYDIAGHLVRIIYPAVALTSLDASGNPVTAAVAPDERYAFDAFGNRVETIDRDGNKVFSFFDKANRLIAKVDGNGYRTDWAYDDLGHVVQEIQYTAPVQVTNAALLPAPAGNAYDSLRTYDAAGRLVEEASPLVVIQTAPGVRAQDRIRTRYTYDKAGNMTSRSGGGVNEHYYYDADNRRVAVVDAELGVTTFTYDHNGNQTSITRHALALNATGLNLATAGASAILAAVQSSAQDEVSTFQYDELNRQKAMIDNLSPSGTAWDDESTTLYDGDGNASVRIRSYGSAAQPQGHQIGTLRKFNAAGLVTGIFEQSLVTAAGSLGRTTVLTYDAAGKQTRSDTYDLAAANPQHLIKDTRYNALGGVTGQTGDDGLWRAYGVDANGNAVATRLYGTRADETADLAGIAGHAPIVSTARYDADNRVISSVGPAVVTSNGTTVSPTTNYQYDYAGHLAAEQDPSDTGTSAALRTTTYTYDGLGNKTSQTDALGNTTHYFYDGAGNQAQVTDARGDTTVKTYDSMNRVSAVTTPDGLGTLYHYDLFGNGVERDDIVDSTPGHVINTFSVYDRSNRLISATKINGFQGGGGATTYAYQGTHVIQTTDAAGRVFTQTFDDAGRVVSTGHLEATTAVTDETLTYNALDQIVTRTDGAGRTTKFTYDPFGHMLSSTDPGGLTTQYTYDRFGRRLTERNAAGRNVTRQYNAAGWLTGVNDAAIGTATSYTYYADGSRASEFTTYVAPGYAINATAPAAHHTRSTQYSYDADGRMVGWQVSDLDGQSTGQIDVQTYTFDKVGNRTSVRDVGYYQSPGTGGVLAQQNNRDVTTSYAFDAKDRVLSLVTSAAGSSAVSGEIYTYDGLGERLSATSTDSSGTAVRVDYTYDGFGHVTSATSTNLTAGAPANLAFSSWTYDAVGNVLSYYQQDSSGSAYSFRKTTTYSVTGQELTTDTVGYPQNADGTINEKGTVARTKVTNTYDAGGRKTASTSVLQTFGTGGSTVETDYTYNYNGDGTISSISGSTPSSGAVGTTTLTYNADGNLINSNDGTVSSSYSYSNDGQIIYTAQLSGLTVTQGDYFYASGNPVEIPLNFNEPTGAGTLTVPGFGQKLIPLQNGDVPSSAVTQYTVQSGDTLQSIASQLFGNPDLWFVLADANGLSADAKLSPNTRLEVPTNVPIGKLNSSTHQVYNSGAITGSSLPTLTPPQPSECAIIGAIIAAVLIAIVAVVLTIVTAGVAAPAAAAALGLEVGSTAALIVGAAVTATIGAAFSLAAGAISQGINIAIGVQKGFDPNQLIVDAVTGIVGGIGEVAGTAIKVAAEAADIVGAASALVKTARAITAAAFNAAGEAAGQAIVGDGTIQQPWMIGVAAGAAGAGEIFGTLGKKAYRALKGESAAAAEVLGEAGATGTDSTDVPQLSPTKRVRFADPLSDATQSESLGSVEHSHISADPSVSEADVAASGSEGGPELELNGTSASDAFKTNRNSHALEPDAPGSGANRVASEVGSPVALDHQADPSVQDQVKALESGQTARFDKPTVDDFNERTVGQVHDKTEPLTAPTEGVAPVSRNPEGNIVFDDAFYRSTGKAANNADYLGLDSFFSLPAREEIGSEIAKAAANSEPQISADLRGQVESLGGKLQLFEHRLKTLSSLADKLLDTPKAQVFDAVRYTAVYEPEKFTANTISTLTELGAKGYEVVRLKNTFEKGNDYYKGINIVLKAPKLNGQGKNQFLELQFHTPQSYKVNHETHDLYELRRVLPKGDPKIAEIEQQQLAIVAKIVAPKDVGRITDFDATSNLLDRATMAEKSVTEELNGILGTLKTKFGKNTLDSYGIVVDPSDPEATKSLLALAVKNNVDPAKSVQLIGFDYRLKTKASLFQKLADTPANQTYDNLRYTVGVADPDNLAESADTVKSRLIAEKYQFIRAKNTFVKDSNYQGINSVFKSPDGQYFEVQFHSNDSFLKNKLTHDLYEEKRQLLPTDARYQELQDQSKRIANTIKIPENIQKDFPTVQDTRAVLTNEVPGYLDRYRLVGAP